MVNLNFTPKDDRLFPDPYDELLDSELRLRLNPVEYPEDNENDAPENPKKSSSINIRGTELKVIDKN